MPINGNCRYNLLGLQFCTFQWQLEKTSIWADNEGMRVREMRGGDVGHEKNEDFVIFACK